MRSGLHPEPTRLTIALQAVGVESRRRGHHGREHVRPDRRRDRGRRRGPGPRGRRCRHPHTRSPIARRRMHAADPSDRPRAPLWAMRRHGPDTRLRAITGIACRRGCRTGARSRLSGLARGDTRSCRGVQLLPDQESRCARRRGAVVTSDPDVAERARLLRNYGERDRYESTLRGSEQPTRSAPGCRLARTTAASGHVDRPAARLAAGYLKSFGTCGLVLPVEAIRA